MGLALPALPCSVGLAPESGLVGAAGLVPSQPGLASLGTSCGRGPLAIHTPPAWVEGELEGVGMGPALFGELCSPVLGYEPLPQVSGVTNMNRTQTREKMFSVSN